MYLKARIQLFRILNEGFSINCCRQSRFSTIKPNLSNDLMNFDVGIIGGGIIGSATAREIIKRYPQLKYVLLEKETSLGFHQSGHNSGVLHSGIYYQPGSLRAKLCVEGIQLAYDYCDEKNIPYKKCGKLIVAVDQSEIQSLLNLYERGQKNGAKNLRLVDAKEIGEIEPNCQGVKAIFSPDTGIVDWSRVNRSFGDDFIAQGGKIKFGFEVEGIMCREKSDYPIQVQSGNGAINCKYLVTCCGLHSDKLAIMTGCSPYPCIVPFRAEYLIVKTRPNKPQLVHGNIYPVPDPRLPFLGVHFTPRLDGNIWLGPNAILALKREGYNATDVDTQELCSHLSNSGLRKLSLRHWKYGLKELYRGINTQAQVKQLQRYVPSLKYADVQRGPSGVRAQALTQEGTLVEEFIFDRGERSFANRVLHVRNAPSPGATSSLAIAKVIADKCKETFDFI